MSPPRDHQNSDSSTTLRQLRSILSPTEAETPPKAAGRGSTRGIRRGAPAELDVVTTDDLLAMALDTEQRSSRVIDIADLLGDTDNYLDEVRPLEFAPGSLRPRPAPGVAKPQLRRDRVAGRRDGVAPFVRPSARRSKRKRRRDYRKLGFIELTQEKTRLRHRVLPRTVLGVSTFVMAFGVGAAFAGASLYAYYDYRLSQNEQNVGDAIKNVGNDFTQAVLEIQRVRDESISGINDRLKPLQSQIDDVNAVVALRERVGHSTYIVRTKDTAGRDTIGAAFVVSADGQTLLLTSYDVVAASAAAPGPEITIERPGEAPIKAELYKPDPARDLALLRVAKPNLAPALPWASDSTRAAAANKRIYAVSGLGGAGSTVAQGMTQDQSQAGLRHDIRLAPDFRGGPLVNSAGEVLGVATTARPCSRRTRSNHS